MEEIVRRALASALWGKLCDAIELECSQVNSGAEKRRLAVERKPFSLTVKDLKTEKTLSLSYQEDTPWIVCRHSGKPESKITFRAERIPDPVPVLTLMLNGLPWITQDLALQLVVTLTH